MTFSYSDAFLNYTRKFIQDFGTWVMIIILNYWLIRPLLIQITETDLSYYSLISKMHDKLTTELFC